MSRHVQAHHHPGCGNPGYRVPENCLWTFSGGEAGVCRIQKAGRLSGLDHFVRDGLRDPVLDNQSDPLDLEMMSIAATSRQEGAGAAATGRLTHYFQTPSPGVGIGNAIKPEPR